MVLWQRPDTPVMSCFHVRMWLRACSNRALSCLCALFHVGAWCSDPGTHVLNFGFMFGVRTLVLRILSHCVSVRSRVLISYVFVSCFAHGWWFVLLACACVFVLCEHMAFVLVFCVPCALMSIVLTLPILFPDYWLVCPTSFSSLPSSFAPFIISLSLLSCASSSSNVSCSCLALPCLASPRLASGPAFPLPGSFSLFIFFNKSPFSAVLSLRLIPSSKIF